ncbi:lipopolysaccharide biosynthesis protein [Bacillus sp. MMSF_3328]|uniref:lipopolysaccharide biosynthesis protein n=1 Tax=Bacillus sp. MMSF_3328 TaxID=3047080 RepID=UPI00273D5DC2|nr:oligosaccharide flippase family protein [Bacillus sp. MMSF_3328]
MSNKFIRSVSLLASSSVIAQLISFLVSPITTRLFTPEEYGVYTLIITAISIFGPVICLKYDMAIVIAKSERESYSIIKLCINLCVVLSITLGATYGLLFLREEFTGVNLLIIIISLIILLIVYGVNNIFLSYNNRKSLYKIISSVTVIKSCVSNSLLVLGGLLNLGIIALVSSNILGSIAGIGKQSKDVRKNFNVIKLIKFNELKKVFFEFRYQPMFNASSALLTTVTYSSINLFIKEGYSTSQLGLYSLSYRVLGIPFSVISANIARVFFDNAVREKKEVGNFQKTFKKTLFILLITIIPTMTFLGILAPWLFHFIFGSEWKEAGQYVRILAPMFAVRLITESLTTSFIVSKRQNLELVFQATLLVCELTIFLIVFINKIQIESFLFLLSVIYMLIHGTMLFYMYKLSTETAK